MEALPHWQYSSSSLHLWSSVYLHLSVSIFHSTYPRRWTGREWPPVQTYIPRYWHLRIKVLALFTWQVPDLMMSTHSFLVWTSWLMTLQISLPAHQFFLFEFLQFPIYVHSMAALSAQTQVGAIMSTSYGLITNSFQCAIHTLFRLAKWLHRFSHAAVREFIRLIRPARYKNTKLKKQS